jgi:O-antigen/teichoic acid export membrane protein
MSAVAARPASLGTNARLALIGDVASKAAQLAVLVLAARLLPTRELAALGICLTLATVLTVFLDAGVSTVLVRECASDPHRGWASVAGTARARLPLALAVVAACVAGGLMLGRPLDGFLVAGLAILGGAALTLYAVFRAAQTLETEAEQKIIAAGVTFAAAAALTLHRPTAAAVLVGLALGPAVTLPGLALRAQRYRGSGGVARLLRSAAPFGAMGLGTLLYYRAPTLILGATRPSVDTASYTLASTVAFGLLMVPNAITTALLPRLSADEDADTARRALARTLQLWAVLSLVVGVAAGFVVPTVFGERYAAATGPLVVLLLSGFAIGISGVIGTVIVARRGSMALMVQVAVCLVVNIGLGAILIPWLGPMGAAADTVVTELLAVALLARQAPDLFSLRVPASIRIPVLPALALSTVTALTVFVTHAAATTYDLRVISDSPTFLALIRDMALHPLRPVNPFLAHGGGEAHASPYTQLLAWIWGRIGPAERLDPVALGHFLGLAGLGVMLLVLHAVFVFTRREVGSRAAWLSLPVLLVLFGPAHVIWAGDLTFNGFLYGGYFPQTVGTALALYTLLLTDGEPCRERYVLGSLLTALTLVVHPFTGILLAVLICVRAVLGAAQRDSRWQVGPLCLTAGFALALVWPAYSVDRAMGETGLPGHTLVAALAILPVLVSVIPLSRLRSPLLWLVRPLDRPLPLVKLGGAIVLALATWECFLFTRRSTDPLIHSNHLSLYWVEDRWRWPLMFAAGATGVAGLARLAARGRPLPLLWFGGCFGAGLAGAGGIQLPLWWRFLLFCQIPLALGTALVLAEARPGSSVRRWLAATLVFCAVFKVVTLTELSPRIRYYGTSLQASYELGKAIPPGPGLVASDPFTSYFIPGTTGRRVLVVTKAHVGSRDELAAANQGYVLLHRFALGRRWWAAAQRMYRLGVRYVVIEKSTSLRPRDLVTFSTGPTPLVRTAADRRWLGTYFYRNNRVGRLVYDTWPYAVYRLDPKRLFG